MQIPKSMVGNESRTPPSKCSQQPIIWWSKWIKSRRRPLFLLLRRVVFEASRGIFLSLALLKYITLRLAVTYGGNRCINRRTWSIVIEIIPVGEDVSIFIHRRGGGDVATDVSGARCVGSLISIILIKD